MSERKPERRGLGRGLSALMADVAPAVENAPTPAKAEMTVPIEKIRPNPDQPRRSFAEEALEDLANSIREKGIIQPLILLLAGPRAGSRAVTSSPSARSPGSSPGPRCGS